MNKHISELIIFIIIIIIIIIIIVKMTREIEIKISNQSDVISSNILNEKKRDVDKLIHDLSSISSNYISISVSSRDSILHERLQLKSQTSFSLFILFFCFTLLQIMIKHINIKINLKRFEVIDQARSWKESTSTEIKLLLRFFYIWIFVSCLVSSTIEIIIQVVSFISWSSIAWVVNDESKSNDFWKFSIS